MELEIIEGKKYKNRSGDLVRIVAVDVDLGRGFSVIGEGPGDKLESYTSEGRFSRLLDDTCPLDLVEGPIDERPEVDWDRVLPWFNALAEDDDGGQYFYSGVPAFNETGGLWEGNEDGDLTNYTPVPEKYEYNLGSDWKESLRVRPGYEKE
jgi:hypothetical protein